MSIGLCRKGIRVGSAILVMVSRNNMEGLVAVFLCWKWRMVGSRLRNRSWKVHY